MGLLRTLLIFVSICAALALVFRGELSALLERGGAAFPTPAGVDATALERVYRQLGIAPLNRALVVQEKIAGGLKDLTISFCDKTAIYRLYKGLEENKERKSASVALLSFADACPNSEGERNAAASLLYGMGDYAAVLPIIDKLVALRPEVAQYYYTRGQTLNALGRFEESASDFSSALSLMDDLKEARSGVFVGLANAYAATGKYCQAMTAIQTYVQADPLERDIAASRKLIADYGAKGSCAQSYARGSEVIPRTKQDVTIVKAAVNGVVGSFILDTGASLVALGPDFAKSAKVSSGPSARRLVMHTANGVADAVLATLDSVEVGKVRADTVSAAIMSKPVAPGIDGLLGMSFLARFDVAMNAKAVQIKERQKGAAE